MSADPLDNVRQGGWGRSFRNAGKRQATVLPIPSFPVPAPHPLPRTDGLWNLLCVLLSW